MLPAYTIACASKVRVNTLDDTNITTRSPNGTFLSICPVMKRPVTALSHRSLDQSCLIQPHPFPLRVGSTMAVSSAQKHKLETEPPP